jgi:hypothetical protein
MVSFRPCVSTVTVALLLIVALFLTSCEKPDPSYTTSPSAKALLGTTTGNLAFGTPDAPPAPLAKDPAGWQVRFELALFNELEDGTDALRILMQAKTERGAGMEIWLANEKGTVARWSGGSTEPYDGVVCFQMTLRQKGEALNLPPGDYTATLVFRDVEKGPIVARRLKVTGNVPKLKGASPAGGSPVFRDLLGCPRGS